MVLPCKCSKRCSAIRTPAIFSPFAAAVAISSKVLWHDGLGMSLYAKRLERGKFIWPSPADGVVVITPAQLAYMLEGIDWRHPQRTWRPEAVG